MKTTKRYKEKIVQQQKDIKKIRLNKKINNQTLDYNSAEVYAPITDLQKKQTEAIENQTEAQQH